MDEKTLQDACAQAIENYQSANYQALLWTPDKHRIEGTNIMAEIAYYATPTAKTCSVKLWRAQRPHPCYQTSFPLVTPQEKDGVISMAEYAPAQVAILKGDRIEFVTQTQTGMIPHPDLAQYAVALTSLEAKIGPIQRQKRPGHLRLI
ncbi:hypothetical protein [Yoonia sp. BS5-3]|uniref:Uncharacterized protein n=1 Tax=Yoonia phaeophyticola TaxID=3137369 RepID=A0ABZ2V7K2_9RHOB